MTDKITPIAAVSESARHWRPEDMLKEALESLAKHPASKVAIVFGRNKPDRTDIDVWVCGMGGIESLGLLAAGQHRIMHEGDD